MDEQLGSVLAVLVARTGARAVRVVDGRSGEVLAQVGAVLAEDVPALVALARDAAPGPEDLVLPTGDGVHVLRSFDVAFLHLRVDAGDGVAAARRELASPELRRAVDGALDGITRRARVPTPRQRPGSPSPVPPTPEPGRHARPAPPVRQPALAALGSSAVRPERAGPLAVLALPAVDSPTAALPAAAARPPVTLPRRAVASAPGPRRAAGRPLALPEVLRQEWAVDAATMARMLDGLRRLN